MMAMRKLLASAVVLAALACGDSVRPAVVDGNYRLTHLNGTTLPYDHDGLGCCTYLSGRLELEQNRYTITITARNRNTGLVFTASENGTFTRNANTLAFEREGFVIQPLLLDTAVVTDTEIALAFGGEGPGSPDQFHAVFERD